MNNSFDAINEAANSDLVSFWGELAKDIAWDEPPQRILNDDNPPFLSLV